MARTYGGAVEMFLYAGSDRTWPYKVYAGREVSELHEKRSAVVWQEFLRSAGSCGGVCCERIWPCL